MIGQLKETISFSMGFRSGLLQISAFDGFSVVLSPIIISIDILIKIIFLLNI